MAWLRILRGVVLANVILFLGYTLPQSYAERRLSEVQLAMRGLTASERQTVAAWRSWQVSAGREPGRREGASDRLRPRSAALPYLQEQALLARAGVGHAAEATHLGSAKRDRTRAGSNA